METKLKLNDLVRVTMFNSQMRDMFGYRGDLSLGDVVRITDCPNDGTIRLGGETGPCWINKDAVELVEDKDTPTMPTFFKDLSDEEKGAILFARFNSEPYQLYNPLDGAWYDDTDMIDDDMAYRLKPQELIEAENRKKDLIAALDELEEQLSAY